MYAGYGNESGSLIGVIALFEGDADKRRVEWELENKLAPDGDPERPPKNAPEDKWLRIGQLAGATLGAVSGAIVGSKYNYVSPGSTALVGLVLGATVGIVTGTIVGAAISRVRSASVHKHSSQ